MFKATGKIKLQWETIKVNKLTVHRACLELTKFWESPLRYFLIPLNSGEWTAVRSTFDLESEDLEREGIGYYKHLTEAKTACETDANEYMKGK